MKLPDYFLADLPPEAALTAAMITEACHTLKRNRERYLAARSTESMINTICTLAEDWRQPDAPFRKLALESGPGETGFSRATLSRGLDGFFGELTPENLHAMVAQELGQSQRLDQFVATPAEQKSGRLALARGPVMLVHLTAGNLPNPTLLSIVLGLLVRSAQFVKCASSTSLLPRLFAHSLYEMEPKLGACLEIAEWRGGRDDLETVLYAEADCVTVTGADETLAEVRGRVPPHVRLLGYGHRVSFGYVAHEVLSNFNARKLAAQAATDVVTWDQQGCLSPHVFYVERGGSIAPEQFAEMLADELARREETEPRGKITVQEAAAIAARRGFYEIRAAAAMNTRHWTSRGSTAWTVIYEADPQFQLSCLNRFVYIKEVTRLSDALNAAEMVRGKVSTVSLAAPESRAQRIATELAEWGVTRICPLGQMQRPPLAWRHDGRPSLGDLVVWTDWEQSRL
jgi:hypothetical protein